MNRAALGPPPRNRPGEPIRLLVAGSPRYHAEPVPGSTSSMSVDALRHVDSLYGFARKLCRNPDAAEDLVQETFARALAAKTQFAEGTNLKAWLFKILRNLHVDALRRAGKSPVMNTLEPNEASWTRSDDAELLRGDAELEALRNLVAEDIDAALSTLSTDARTIVLLDFEGFTEPELVEVLGCAPGTVKSRLARARATLRERLEEYGR
ncbi:MAG TPA: sigma-70 family RNA polymerase sigma factor [Polyangiaceae bacterium]|nr:sigma-70 family RNA polymerase sigma factor [Polyangiaceae bacterium]